MADGRQAFVPLERPDPGAERLHRRKVWILAAFGTGVLVIAALVAALIIALQGDSAQNLPNVTNQPDALVFPDYQYDLPDGWRSAGSDAGAKSSAGPSGYLEITSYPATGTETSTTILEQSETAVRAQCDVSDNAVSLKYDDADAASASGTGCAGTVGSGQAAYVADTVIHGGQIYLLTFVASSSSADSVKAILAAEATVSSSWLWE